MADQEEMRRDKTPLFRTHGDATAVLCSHALVALGYDQLMRSEHAQDLVKAWNESYLQACVGQYQDYRKSEDLSLTDQQVLSQDKTISFFRFVGHSLDLILEEARYAELFSVLGRSFQIGNDVVDLLNAGVSERISADGQYPLRLSFLTPLLVEHGVIDKDELFLPVSAARHQQIALTAKDMLLSSEEMLGLHQKRAQKRICELKLSEEEHHMASEFIEHCQHYSFWYHHHDQ